MQFFNLEVLSLLNETNCDDASSRAFFSKKRELVNILTFVGSDVKSASLIKRLTISGGYYGTHIRNYQT